MQLSIFPSGVNRIPNCAIGILNLFNICLLSSYCFNPTIWQQHIPDSTMKKLRRLPHVFNYFREFPFCSDAYAAVEEKEGFYRFMEKIELEGDGDGQVRAKVVEIHPGVTKIVVRKGNGDGEDEQLNVGTGGIGFLLRQCRSWPRWYLWTESL
ncbi:hypothetical protein H5410_032313 [Solanum commersonii]|uniref:Uncharacterized protein n=1 Tax=Solanum commersonii TaxID=4109 RepID=A0A9J5YMJ1_SOLCO|nr:hypothetical protein H5410_032313 [Solanum commersonii]